MAPIREIVRAITELARKNFESEGELMPVSFFLAADGKAFVMPAGRMNKDELRVCQERMIERLSAVAFVHVTEAWIVRSDPNALFEDLSGPLAEHPKREEIIQATFETRDGESGCFEIPIQRDSVGHATLGPTEEVEATLTGRMTGYFPRTRNVNPTQA